MIEHHPPPKHPEVIGESSKGDMHHRKAWERASVRSAANLAHATITMGGHGKGRSRSRAAHR